MLQDELLMPGKGAPFVTLGIKYNGQYTQPTRQKPNILQMIMIWRVEPLARQEIAKAELKSDSMCYIVKGIRIGLQGAGQSEKVNSFGRGENRGMFVQSNFLATEDLKSWHNQMVK